MLKVGPKARVFLRGGGLFAQVRLWSRPTSVFGPAVLLLPSLCLAHGCDV